MINKWCNKWIKSLRIYQHFFKYLSNLRYSLSIIQWTKKYVLLDFEILFFHLHLIY